MPDIFPDKLFFKLDQLPDTDSDDPFWDTIGSDEHKRAILLLILNELGSCDPATLNDQQCRTQLAKVYSWGLLLNLRESITNHRSVRKDDMDRNDTV